MAENADSPLTTAHLIRMTAGFSCLVAWLVYFVNFAFVASDSLQSTSLFLAIVIAVVIVCVAVAALLLSTSFLQKACTSKPVCIIATAVGLVLQVVFALSTISGVRVACFLLALLVMMPLVMKWGEELAQASRVQIVGCFVCAIFITGVAYGLTWLVGSALGSISNVDVRMTAGLLVCAVLPLVSAILTSTCADAGTSEGASEEVGESTSECASEGAVVHPNTSTGTETSDVTSSPESVAGGAKAVHELREYNMPTLLGLSLMFVTWVMLFFVGFMCSPYWADPLRTFDSMGIMLTVGGAILICVCAIIWGLLVYRRTEEQQRKAGSGLYTGAVIVSLAMAVVSLVMSFLLGDVSHESLAVLLVTCTLLLALGISAAGVNVSLPGIFAGLFVAGGFACQLFGIAIRRQIGIDSATMSSVILILVLMLLVIYVIASVIHIHHMHKESAALDERLQEASAIGEQYVVSHVDSVDPETLQNSLSRIRSRYLKRYNLTNRETEIALLLIDGCTMAEVAEKCGISINTVRYHMKSLYAKTDVQSKNDLKNKVTEVIKEERA